MSVLFSSGYNSIKLFNEVFNMYEFCLIMREYIVKGYRLVYGEKPCELSKKYKSVELIGYLPGKECKRVCAVKNPLGGYYEC